MLRTLVAALVLFACIGTSLGSAADVCGNYDGEWNWLEWTGGSQPRGIRLADRVEKWDGSLANGGGFHGQGAVFCPFCAGDEIVRGRLLLGPAKWPLSNHTWLDAEQLGIKHVTNPYEIVLHPRGFARLSLAMIGYGSLVEVEALGDPEPASVLGLKGSVRTFVTPVNSRPFHVLAFGAVEECFSVVGFFATTDGRKVTVADLAFVDSAIMLQRYEATPRPPRLLPPAVEFPKSDDVPLGDARRRRQEESR